MLSVFSAWDGRACAMLLGGFDGFHAGHRTLLNEAKQTGLPVGLVTIAGNKAGGDVFTLSERRTIFRREGFAFAEEMLFSEIKEISARDFARSLFSRFPIKAVYCGRDFRFGRGAEGDIELLRKIAPCPVYALPLLQEGGEKIAATKLKKYLSEGDMQGLKHVLGYDYFIEGVVEHGRQVGREYGFPTINVSFPGGKYPVKQGVYGGCTETDEGVYVSVVNVGARPTFGVEECAVEAYLEGFSGDLYGKTVKIRLKEFYRPIRKFESVEALRAQLEQDKARLEVLK